MERFADGRQGTGGGERSGRPSRRAGEVTPPSLRSGTLVLVALLVLAATTGVPGVVGLGSAHTVANAGGSLDYEGDAVTVTPEPGQRIVGHADLPPGTRLTVRLRSSGSNPFLISTTAMVAEDGSFRGR